LLCGASSEEGHGGGKQQQDSSPVGEFEHVDRFIHFVFFIPTKSSSQILQGFRVSTTAAKVNRRRRVSPPSLAKLHRLRSRLLELLVCVHKTHVSLFES
jgi:hypothetical protein